MFGKKEPPTSSDVEAPPSSTPHAQTVPGPATSPPRLSAHLWNQAYDQGKQSDPNTVDTYEKILTVQLSEEDATASTTPNSTNLASQQNQIAQDAGERWMQMQRLVQNGLRRTEKDAKVKQGMEDGIQAAMAVKEVADKAIQASPEAAIAWILMNPLTQASSNRRGIAYVVSRMEWYWNLAELLLEENMTDGHSPGLRGDLEKGVTQLYAKLLLYQMKSVCYYHRGRVSVFARDLIKLDDWDGELGDIQAAEAAVQTDSTQIHETSADNKCLADLRLTDPRDDKKRIEETKGGLLKNSYRWVLDNLDFRQWRDEPQSQLLWVKADPGKGKTMLLCGIIDELQSSMGATGLLSYFFCQATDSRIRSAVAVLRGLLYMLISEQPSLISHVRKKYDQAGEALFEDANAILQDPSLKCMYLIVDALDECITDLPKLVDFIAERSSTSSHVKWLVSSRNWQNIEGGLGKVGRKVRLSLELNAQSVSYAVSAFIQHKVFKLAESKTYDAKTRDAVFDHLSSNANDTFLWVALVCQSLEGVPKRNVIKKLIAFPPGLVSLYERMIQQISNLDDASLCKQILSLAAVAYQPLTLDELSTLVEEFEDEADDIKSKQEIIGLCGSIKAAHYAVLSRSFKAMSALHHDMYSLGELRYSAAQIDHLCNLNSSAPTDTLADLQNRGAVHEFLRKKYLYWLEALSLYKNMSKGIVSIGKLLGLQGIENSPLQAYRSALLFSPTGSLIRKLFQDNKSKLIKINPGMTVSWSACLQTLEGHSDSVSSVAFSHDSTQLASASGDKTVKIWNASSGACLQTLEGHSNLVSLVAFSHDSTQLASASYDKTVKIWNVNSSANIGTIALSSLETPNTTSTVATPQSPRYKYTALSSDNIWITFNSKNLLWLPQEYRPSSSAVLGNTLGIGVGSGKV
ncbi:hypothetical protein BU24DRAFT_437817 [Aaosphaeria arxii CBS 175.79]|uniref:NACHT domain-containing protein n=1 Tax=Aaosphaeria arxii CBS 175.79 TaxID=1450172 RepID=A0A6A5X7B9_9PLEO|nr:uncharacterized protein BU24DRAFT_437817 [Aaosphaeria arxii CBS 175.79]KAF2008717.1 hypothetical protein BU24DRAFT_437817 [Aaosphaeria arxii CBS 175.79]